VIRGERTVTIDGRTARVATSTRRFTLYLTFSVRRPVTLGLEAIEGSLIVGSTGLEHLKPRSGQFSLPINPDTWPTGLRFVTDTPTVRLVDPGSSLSGVVTLSARPSVSTGWSVASVRFDVAAAGSNAWTPIATASRRPFSVSFDTTTLSPGRYDLRAVVVDNDGNSAVSRIRTGVQIGPRQ
jgi:hypothetical protein